MTTRPRWTQFSIGFLLVLVAAVCIALSCYYPRAHVSAKFRIAVPSVSIREAQLRLVSSPFVVTAALRDPAISQLPLLMDRSDPVDWLGNELQTTLVDEVVELSLEGKASDAQQLRQIVEAVADAYLKEVSFQELRAMTTHNGKPLSTCITRITD